MPSRRAQIWATAGALAVGRGEGRLGGRGPLHEQPHGLELRPASSSGGRGGVGRQATGRGPGRAASPAIPSASRLVARMRRPGQARSRRSARRAQASTRCSQLSSTSSRRLGPQGVGQRVQRAAGPAPRPAPARRRRAWGTRAGSESGASSTSQTPSGNSSRASAATCSGQAGLARAPRARERHQPRRRQQPAGACPISCSRPTKRRELAGRLCGKDVQRPERREVVGQGGVAELEDLLRAGSGP